jgi:hypothetical protein
MGKPVSPLATKAMTLLDQSFASAWQMGNGMVRMCSARSKTVVDSKHLLMLSRLVKLRHSVNSARSHARKDSTVQVTSIGHAQQLAHGVEANQHACHTPVAF